MFLFSVCSIVQFKMMRNTLNKGGPLLSLCPFSSCKSGPVVWKDWDMVMIIEQRIHLKPMPPPATALALVFTIMKQQTHAQSKQSHTAFQGAQFKLSKKTTTKKRCTLLVISHTNPVFHARFVMSFITDCCHRLIHFYNSQKTQACDWKRLM